MRPSPFTIAADALLRPSRFAAFLAGGRRNVLTAALGVCLWIGAALAFVGLVLPQLVPIGARGIIAGLVLAPLFAVMLAGLGITLSGGSAGPLGIGVAFWLLRCTLVITPALALLFALGFSTLPQRGALDGLIVLGFVLLLGLWIGGALTILLGRSERHEEAAAARAVLAAGAFVVALLVWLSPSLRATGAALLVPFLLGLAGGLLRPLSWLWEALLSVVLAIAGMSGVSITRLRRLHPATMDELCLLPLPGLRALLVRACAADREAGAEWLLEVAGHLGQRRAALAALHTLIRRRAHAHPLLFWLSTSPEGAALLRALAERAPQPHPLIAAYAAFAAVRMPEAWTDVIARWRGAIAGAADMPGGRALLALLEAGHSALRADRWEVATARLRAAPAPDGVEDDPIWVALAIIRSWADGRQPLLAAERAGALQLLQRELQAMEGWPAALLAAVSEHLHFLVEIERRRGAWLI
jgi:hypothetical protein